jgi:hypothetical protein
VQQVSEAPNTEGIRRSGRARGEELLKIKAQKEKEKEKSIGKELAGFK